MTRAEIEKLAEWPLFDNPIVQHGYAAHLRDYDVIVVNAATASLAVPPTLVESRDRYRFTHCVLAAVTSAIPDQLWQQAWSDDFIDVETWAQTGERPGYVWGINFSVADPGLRYVADSQLAAEWTQRLGQPMHEVVIETTCQNIRLVFHKLQVTKIGPKIEQGNPETGEIINYDQTVE